MSNNKTDTEDDEVLLWEKLQLMKDEKERLQKEIDIMNSTVAATATATATSADVKNDDIIEIDAGGKIIRALRSTLTLAPDTMFTYMFSGRWEESLKRNSNGNIFLDHDPELIEIIVNYLRMKKIEDISMPPGPLPKIPEGKTHEFNTILQYFGLTEFFYPPDIYISPIFLPLDINNITVIQSDNSTSVVNVTKSENNVQFSKIGRKKGQHFVACKPSLNSSAEGTFWKVTIDALISTAFNGWIYLGIIGNLNPSIMSYSDSTSHGWAGSSQVYHQGANRNGDSGWTNFTKGECLYFCLKSNKLTMFSVEKNKKFTMDIAATVAAYYIHFNIFGIGTKLTLEPLSIEEREQLL